MFRSIQQKNPLLRRLGCAGKLPVFLAAVLLLGGLPGSAFCGQPEQKKVLSPAEMTVLFSELDSSRKSIAYTGVVEVRYFLRKEGNYPVRVWFKPPNFIHFAPLEPLPDVRPSPQLPPGQGLRPKRGHRPRRPHREEFYRLMPAKKYLELFGRNYEVSLQPDGKIAGRPADLLDIRPKFPPRFGIRLWLDGRNRLILQRQILFYRKERPPRKIVEIGFREINFSPQFPDSVLKKAEASVRRMKKMRAVMEKRHKRIRRFDTLDSLRQALNEPIYVPGWLPRGFDLVSRSLGAEKERKTIHLHYTDGLLNLSIFEIYGPPPKFLMRYLRHRKGAGRRGFRFRELLVRKAGEKVTFLLIGNLPRFELKRIADSMKIL